MLFYHVLPRWNCMVASFSSSSLVVGRSGGEGGIATVHIAATVKKKKKWKKGKKYKREKKEKKDFFKKKQLHFVFNVWLSASIFFSCFLVYFWFVEVSKQVVRWSSFEKKTQLAVGHYLFPICSSSMLSCTWPFCSNKCAIFINLFLTLLFHFILHCSFSVGITGSAAFDGLVGGVVIKDTTSKARGFRCPGCSWKCHIPDDV